MSSVKHELLIALKNNNIDNIKLLLQNPKILSSYLNENDLVILVLAIIKCDIEIIKLLLKHSEISLCFIWHCNKTTYTILHLVLSNLDNKIIKLLLKHPKISSCFNITSRFQQSILNCAIKCRNVEMLKLCNYYYNILK